MISARGALTVLRCSAAVIHCTSGVRLRVAHDGVGLYEVSHPPFPEVDHTLIPACRFRAAVARAHTQHCSGIDIAMRGLPHGVDPQLSYGVRRRDRVLPGGVVRLERDDVWLHVTALARSEPGQRILADHQDRGDLHTLTDDALDVSVAAIPTPAGDTARSTAALDHLSDLAALVAVAEIEAHLALASN